MAKAGAATPEIPMPAGVRAPTYEELLALVKQQASENEILRQGATRLEGELAVRGVPGGGDPVVLSGLGTQEADALRAARAGEQHIDSMAFRRDFKRFLQKETMRTIAVNVPGQGPIQMMFDAKGNLVSVPDGYNPPPGVQMRAISADPTIYDARNPDGPVSSFARDVVHDRDLSPRGDAVPEHASPEQA